MLRCRNSFQRHLSNSRMIHLLVLDAELSFLDMHYRFWTGYKGKIQWYYVKMYSWSLSELHWMNLGIVSGKWTNGQVSGFVGIAWDEKIEPRRIFLCASVNGIFMQGLVLCTDLLLTQAKFPNLVTCFPQDWPHNIYLQLRNIRFKPNTCKST